MKVRDAMTGDVLTMTPGRSLRDAAKFMADHNVGAVVIEASVTGSHVGTADYLAAALTVLGVVVALGMRRRG